MPLAQPFAPFFASPAALPVQRAAAAAGLVPYPAIYQVDLRTGRPGRGELRFDVDEGPLFVTSIRYTSSPAGSPIVGGVECTVRSGQRQLTEGAVDAALFLAAVDDAPGSFGPAARGLPRPIVVLAGDALSLELTPRDPAVSWPASSLLVVGHHLRTHANGRVDNATSAAVAAAVLDDGEAYAASVEIRQADPLVAADATRDARNLSYPAQLETLFLSSTVRPGGSWAGLRLDLGTREVFPTGLSSAVQNSAQPNRFSHDIRVRSLAGQLLTLRAATLVDSTVTACAIGARFSQ